MKKGLKTTIFATLASVFQLLTTFDINAQGKMETLQKTYLEEAGSKSCLFRGKLPEKYSTAYNGNPFWSTKEYVNGEVKYNGKTYTDVLLNIDACRMEILCRHSLDAAPVVLNKQDVQYIRINGRFFVNLRNLGWQDAPKGYFEVIHDGDNPVLHQIRKVFRTDSRFHNGPDIGYYDPLYKENIVYYFRQEEGFYTIKDGAVKQIRKKRAAALSKEPEWPSIETRAADFIGTDAAPDDAEHYKVYSLSGIGLPEGYFDDEPVILDDEEITSSVIATYRNKIYTIGQGKGSNPVTISGYLTDLETGQPISGVVIFDDNTASYERSNNDGSYRITLPPGNNRLNYIAEGKEDISLNVRLLSNGSLNVMLPDKIESIHAAVVSAESMDNHRSAAMGIENLSIRTMSKIPSAFGESDLIKAILTLPGVKSAGESSGGFNVRGGSQDQNLILLNGNTIFNPSHLFGMFSVFNPDIVENAELYKSVIPAEYGGRISSVLAVKTRDGNQERIKGSIGIGPLTSRVQIDGPAGKKTSLIAAARTSYSDWILKKLPKNSAYSGGTADFLDINAGITHTFDEKNVLRINGYFANDTFSFSQDTSYRYNSLSFSSSYCHKTDKENEICVTVGYDRYYNRTSISPWSAGAFNLETGVEQVFLRSKAQTLFGNHSISYGADLVGYHLNPGILTPIGDDSAIIKKSLDRESAIEPAAYVQDTWRVSELFSMEGGLRMSGFVNLGSGSLYARPEFRLSARYSPAVNITFKSGINTMMQNLHLISNNAGISPTDTWKLSDGNIAPTTGWQVASGAYCTLLGSGIDLSAELYYKRSRNGLDLKPGAILIMNKNLYQELIPVYGRSYGIELMAKKTTGNLTGWVSYSYSKAQYKEMRNRGYAAVAAGNWYNTAFDKPHEAKMAVNYALTHRYSFSINADYSTGKPVTIPVGVYKTKDSIHMAYSDRNVYRLPDYFRLDAAINIDPGHYKKSSFHTTFTLGVYNITGRKNAYSAFFKTDNTGQLKGYMLSVFATQIPYANINFLF